MVCPNETELALLCEGDIDPEDDESVQAGARELIARGITTSRRSKYKINTLHMHQYIGWLTGLQEAQLAFIRAPRSAWHSLAPPHHQAVPQQLLSVCAVPSTHPGAKNVVVTLGSKGCMLVSSTQVPFEGCAKFSTRGKVLATDTVGAGDAFLGSLGAYLARGLTLEAAVGKAVR